MLHILKYYQFQLIEEGHSMKILQFIYHVIGNPLNGIALRLWNGGVYILLIQHIEFGHIKNTRCLLHKYFFILFSYRSEFYRFSVCEVSLSKWVYMADAYACHRSRINELNIKESIIICSPQNYQHFISTNTFTWCRYHFKIFNFLSFEMYIINIYSFLLSFFFFIL